MIDASASVDRAPPQAAEFGRQLGHAVGGGAVVEHGRGAAVLHDGGHLVPREAHVQRHPHQPGAFERELQQHVLGAIGHEQAHAGTGGQPRGQAGGQAFDLRMKLREGPAALAMHQAGTVGKTVGGLGRHRGQAGCGTHARSP